MTLDALLASGRLGATPLRWLEPLFSRAERRWTDRELPVEPPLHGQAFVIGVAGALRGGSWKTPLSVGLVRALAERERAVCWVGRGYRSRAGFEGALVEAESAASAGDEAFASWGALRSGAADLFVARSFQRGLALASAQRPHGFAVLDGCRSRIAPGLGRSLVAVDGLAAGTTVWPHTAGPPVGLGVSLSRGDRWLVPVIDVRERAIAEPLGATYDLVFDRVLSPEEIANALLVTTHARPERLLDALSRRGFTPRAHLRLGDHAGPSEVRRGLSALGPRARRRPFSLVLAPDKAHLALRQAGPLPAPLGLLSCAVTPAPSLVDALIADAGKLFR